MTPIRFALSSDTLSEAALQDRLRSLRQDIVHNSDATATAETGAAHINAKGEPITLGVLLVTFMTSGAAVAALNVLKSYLERDRSLTMTVERADGAKMSLTAANIGDVRELADSIIANPAGG